MAKGPSKPPSPSTHHQVSSTPRSYIVPYNEVLLIEPKVKVCHDQQEY